ncbi:MAG: 2-dehydropantoate 2-reductase N-terminal domain-containing protein [Solirubrobacteraceae bacterium]|nr:2-dehydropantoate 2-reductase N-terminal domain-containing protein [Solirubrobacteraceae bacterium]
MPDGRQRPSLSLPSPIARRAIVVGAGSFGTAVAVLLARGGLRTTLQTRTSEQARRLQEDRENLVYLPGVEFPRELRVESVEDGLGRADYVFLGVPSHGLGETIRGLRKAGLGTRTAVISLAKGLTPPDGTAPTVLLRERFGEERVACVGGPSHAREMVSEGAALVAASTNEELANTIAGVFIRAGVVCERSNDPIGVELAGAAKNAAGLAAGATEAQGLNAAGAAAGHIFAEVWRYGEAQGARPESMLGLAGTGDLVATVLAPQSRNRRAGELLAAGVPAAEIPERIGQAVEALESVPLLARALRNAGLEATVTDGLAQLISGELPLDEWIGLVRTTVPPPARWRRRPAPGFWSGLWTRMRGGGVRRRDARAS